MDIHPFEWREVRHDWGNCGMLDSSVVLSGFLTNYPLPIFPWSIWPFAHLKEKKKNKTENILWCKIKVALNIFRPMLSVKCMFTCAYLLVLCLNSAYSFLLQLKPDNRRISLSFSLQRKLKNTRVLLLSCADVSI